MNSAGNNMVTAGSTSFGPGQNTNGPADRFRAKTFLDSERWRELDRRASYRDCTQHDYKRYDFEGRIITSAGGIGVTQPLLGAERVPYYIPLRARRPSSPYRLPRVIVNAFTSLIMGEGRFPTMRVTGDSDAEEYVKALVKAMKLPTKMIRARNLGGSAGSVGLSWCFLNGKPRMQVHKARDCYIHEWEDRDECIPRHVTELYTFTKDEWDGAKKRYVTNVYYKRRDWTPNVDVVFKPALIKPGIEPEFEPDLDKSSDHRDGLIHFVWIQNQVSDEVDGLPDYEGLYENFDYLDLLLSVIGRGAVLNLDPTLKLKMDPDMIKAMGIRKGSDNALIVGEKGDADYLELAGLSIKAGIDLFNAKRRAALEVAQCVLPDPDQISANGTSSVAMKMLYAPMLGAADLLREQYGAGVERLLEGPLTIARNIAQSTEIFYGEDGTPQKIEKQILLPPKSTEEPVLDDDGNPTGETNTTTEELNPGEGGEIEPDWGPYFPPTPADQQVVVGTLSVACGTQPFMSTQTATEIAMKVFNRSATDEATRVAQEKQQQQAQQSQMFADQQGAMGGKVGAPGQLPPGAKPKPGGKPQGGGGKPGGGAPPGGAKKGAGGTGTESSAPKPETEIA